MSDELDQVSDADAAQLAAEADLDAAGAVRGDDGDVQLQVALHELVIQQANLRVLRNEQTGERAVLIGPLLLNIVLPLSQEGAHGLARELAGGVIVASAVPPDMKVVKPR